jgi:hypothetical protein
MKNALALERMLKWTESHQEKSAGSCGKKSDLVALFLGAAKPSSLGTTSTRPGT